VIWGRAHARTVTSLDSLAENVSTEIEQVQRQLAHAHTHRRQQQQTIARLDAAVAATEDDDGGDCDESSDDGDWCPLPPTL
jgi:septal ring factor EnvC (AmiA/AmiB activator)